MWYNTETNKTMVFDEVIRKNPNVSWTKEILERRTFTSDTLHMLGLTELVGKAEPEYDEELQYLEPEYGDIEIGEDGNAYYSWTVHDIFQDELDENGKVVRTAAQVKADLDEENRIMKEEEEALEAERILEAAVNNATWDRNVLLQESDKFVIPDWPHASEEDRQAWVTYRQALRDLPNSEDWPYVTFPKAPNA